MAIYQYSCHACQHIMEHDFPFGKPKTKVKCPECKAMCEQHYAGRDMPVHFKGAGWTGKNAQTGYNKKGGSDEVNLKLQEQSQDRIDGGWKMYSKFTPPQKLLDKARKLTDKEVQNKLTSSKKISDVTYNKAGIDPHNKYKGQ